MHNTGRDPTPKELATKIKALEKKNKKAIIAEEEEMTKEDAADPGDGSGAEPRRRKSSLTAVSDPFANWSPEPPFLRKAVVVDMTKALKGGTATLTKPDARYPSLVSFVFNAKL